MPSTTRFRRGDVVLVPFPFTDLSSTKQRPALVVSQDTFNGTRDDLLVVAVTSQDPSILSPDEFLIPAAKLAACGPPKPSILKLTKLVTLHRRLIVNRIGALPDTTPAQALARLRGLIYSDSTKSIATKRHKRLKNSGFLLCILCLFAATTFLDLL